MIICICENVSESEIRSCINNDVKTFEDVQSKLGVCVHCRRCEEQIYELLDEIRNKEQ